MMIRRVCDNYLRLSQNEPKPLTFFGHTELFHTLVAMIALFSITGTSFVATKLTFCHLSRQKTCFVETDTYLSRCRDKLLSRQKWCLWQLLAAIPSWTARFRLQHCPWVVCEPPAEPRYKRCVHQSRCSLILSLQPTACIHHWGALSLRIRIRYMISRWTNLRPWKYLVSVLGLKSHILCKIQ